MNRMIRAVMVVAGLASSTVLAEPVATRPTGQWSIPVQGFVLPSRGTTLRYDEAFGQCKVGDPAAEINYERRYLLTAGLAYQRWDGIQLSGHLGYEFGGASEIHWRDKPEIGNARGLRAQDQGSGLVVGVGVSFPIGK